MSEHPVQQIIQSIVLDGCEYAVGIAQVTRIEACTKSGMHSDIPYIRVWTGEIALLEVCQHKLDALWFDPKGLPDA